MRKLFTLSVVCGSAMMTLCILTAPRAAAQDPMLTPIIVSEVAPMILDEAKPIIVKLAPKPKPTGVLRFDGYIVHANVAQVTVRAKGDDLGIQTFPLNQDVATKMQKIVDNGGYQYGDKVTIYYDPSSRTAVKIKGKPSRPL
jgi:hypothetical protein